MKKLLLASIAALLLATGTAHAEEKRWWPDCRHGWITKQFEETEIELPRPAGEPLQGRLDWPEIEITDDNRVRITHDELRNLLKDLPKMMPVLKACWAFRKCQSDRDAGKVKHCYRNDRRWREFITEAW